MSWHQLTAKSTDYELGYLGQNEFKVDIGGAFTDVASELKLRQQLAVLRQTASVASYTKEFRRLALELGNQVPDDSALMFKYVEGLKPAMKMQVLLARSSILIEVKQLVERADMAIFISGQQHCNRQPRCPHGQNYQLPRHFQPLRPPPGPIPMDLSSAQGQPRMPPCGSQNGRNGNRTDRQFLGQCFHCGRPGHIARDQQRRTGNRPQRHQGSSVYMGL